MQSIKRTAAGLVTNPNAFGEAPEGTLHEAENCDLARPGMITKRRGFKVFGGPITASALLEYKARLLANDAVQNKLYYDSVGNGTWIAYDGSFAPPDSAYQMRGEETQGVLLVTTSDGVKRTDQLTKTPKLSGMPYGLQIKLSTAGTGDGWFPANSQVGYRVVFGRVDESNRLLLGGPSMREVVTNNITTLLAWARSGGGPYTVTVTHTAHGYATNDIIQVTDATPTFLNGPQTITVTGANAYTFSVASDPGASGTFSVGKKLNVIVKFPLPDDLEEGDFYDIYRTSPSVGSTVDPRDKQKRVSRTVLTAATVTLTAAGTTVTVAHTAHGMATGDIARIFSATSPLFDGKFAITVTNSDTYTYTAPSAPPSSGSAKAWPMLIALTDDWDLALSDKLYTNLDEETIDGANSRPPWSKDISIYRDVVHYGNTRKPHHLEIQLQEIAGLVDGTSSITLVQGATELTYTFHTAENVSLRRFQRYTALPTTAQNIAATMRSLCWVINADPGSLWYASYISGVDDAPGLVAIESRNLSATEFSVKSNNNTTGVKFTPSIPTTSGLYASDNEVGTNRLYYAKVGQPEAVPDLNWDPIGEDTNEIVASVPTRDSLIIATKNGVYRKAGTTESTFTIEGLDLTIEARAPRTWRGLNNAVYGLGTTGVLKITETGTQLISWSIDDKIKKLLQFPNYESLAFATAYESENIYVLWVPETPTDTKATVGWIFHTLNRKWYGPWRKNCLSAFVKSSGGKLYLSRADTVFPRVLEERRSATDSISDYQDENFPVTVSAIETATVEGATKSVVTITGWAYTETPGVGWSFLADPAILTYAKVIAAENPIAGTYKLTLDKYFPGLSTGSAEVAMPIIQRIRWAPEAAENVSAMKQFMAVHLYMERTRADHNRIGFYSDVEPTETFYGELVFDEETAGGRMVRDCVPAEFQRARTLSLIYENRYALEAPDIAWVAFDVRLTGDRTMARSKS